MDQYKAFNRNRLKQDNGGMLPEGITPGMPGEDEEFGEGQNSLSDSLLVLY